MYIHTDFFSEQSSKKTGQPCGDVFGVLRDLSATTIVLADGLGSGIKAHISATMCVSRLTSLIHEGASIREAFNSVTDTMDKAWGTGAPFSVFTVARILNNGHTTILSYEMPPPILVSPIYAQILKDRVYTQKKAIIHEATCILTKEEGILLVSDGITQAGIGQRFINGWESEGVWRYIESKLNGERINGDELVSSIHAEAKSYWPKDKGDDCSVILGLNRRGVIVNLICGPPLKESDDEKWVKSFIKAEGIHIVSGGTTAKIVAKVAKKQLEVNESESPITPPSYHIDGYEMVTEGIVTLNQVYNLLDEDNSVLSTENTVGELIWYLKMADRINIWEGKAPNSGHDIIEFRQQGLLDRNKIVHLIAEKLRNQGKLIVHNTL